MLKGKVDALQTGRKEAIGKISIAEAKAVTADKGRTKAEDEAKAATEKLTASNEAKDKAVAEAEMAKKDAAEKQVVIAAKDDEIKRLKDNPPPAVGMVAQKDFDEAKAQLADMTTQKDNAIKERDEAKQAFDSAAAKSKAGEDELAKLQKENRERSLHLGRAGLRARILAVNGGWNFVVLSVGDKQGISVDDPLIVVRGNEPVAKLRITSVEPSTSIADVIPSSVRRGISIQPGDTVIFQGRTSSTQPENKPAPEPAASATVAPLLPAQ
jgi:hypothetical protein